MKLHKWIYAAYLLMTARKGISSLQLSKELSTRQETAWYMLHRLRVACGDNLKVLRGKVEVDEAYLGGIEKNKHERFRKHQGTGSSGKQVVMGLRERGGQTVMELVGGQGRESLLPVIDKYVRPGATIYTDENTAYSRLRYRHQTVNHSAKEFVNGMAHTNGIESVWAVLKRGFTGTYHQWSKKHCQAYINEFAFRLNEGNCERDTQDRLDDLFRAMVGKTITFQKLTS